MGPIKAVLDTNILIDYLNGVEPARKELALYRDPCISRISWMEVLAGVRDPEQRDPVLAFLRSFRILELNEPVAGEAVDLRRERKLRLPDAIVLASARVEGCILVTRNVRDFDPAWPEIREPYRLSP